MNLISSSLKEDPRGDLLFIFFIYAKIKEIGDFLKKSAFVIRVKFKNNLEGGLFSRLSRYL